MNLWPGRLIRNEMPEIFRIFCKNTSGLPCPAPACPPGRTRSGGDRIQWTKQEAAAGCAAEPLPAAETGEAEQGPPSKCASGLCPAPHIWATATRSRAPVFASTLRGAPQKSAKRKSGNIFPVPPTAAGAERNTRSTRRRPAGRHVPALSRLRGHGIWCRRRGSNPRPPVPKTGALPTALQRHGAGRSGELLQGVCHGHG